MAALTRYYEALNLKRGADVLDICSSWVSHYPKSWPKLAKSIVGTGISATELACNDQLPRLSHATSTIRRCRLPTRASTW